MGSTWVRYVSKACADSTSAAARCGGGCPAAAITKIAPHAARKVSIVELEKLNSGWNPSRMVKAEVHIRAVSARRREGGTCRTRALVADLAGQRWAVPQEQSPPNSRRA